MRNPDRLDSFYEELKNIHKEYVPDWRFGQFMCNVLGNIGVDPFFSEEKEMIKLIKNLFKKEEDSND